MKLPSRFRPVNDHSVAPSPALVPVISGATCIGFLIRRGREGIAAHDSNEQLLGLFSAVLAAAAAVERSAAPGERP
jgi:hypothetical protein